MTRDHTPPHPDEHHELAKLPRSASPDPAVEERVVASLRERGLLGLTLRDRLAMLFAFPTSRAWSIALRSAAGMAVLAVVFLVGTKVGERRATYAPELQDFGIDLVDMEITPEPTKEGDPYPLVSQAGASHDDMVAFVVVSDPYQALDHSSSVSSREASDTVVKCRFSDDEALVIGHAP
jgi:hypothetical protein